MSVRQMASMLLRSGPGRAGAVLLAVMVALSLFAVARFPLDFGSTRWNNPAEWADNPSAAPPSWTALFSRRAVEHAAFRAREPSRVEPASAGEARSYSFDYHYRGGKSPTFITFAVSDVRFTERPPVFTVAVSRPDGRVVSLYRVSVRGPRPGETAPYARYTDTPLRTQLSTAPETQVALASFLRDELGANVFSGDLSGKVEEAVFGVPGAQAGEFDPLPGTYRFTVEAFTSSPQDTVGEVRLVVGGTAYGLMGTDSLGRDLALGLLFGFPVALAIGIVTSVVTTGLGAFLGILSGYMGGKTDLAVQRFADIWSNIPLLPILVFLIFILGQHLWLVVLIMIVFGWPGLTILVRSMTLQMRTGQLVEATRALGASRWRIMMRHVLFQVAPFVFAQMVFFTPAAILAEAGLSFLGLGDPSIPTWGQILESGFRTGAVYVGYWWWILPPGLLVVLTAMAFVLLALGLEPVLNPKLRKAR